MAVPIAVTMPAPLARAILVKDLSSASSLQCPSVYLCHCNPERKELPFPPNALRRKIDPKWRGGFSLGIDLGLSRTGLALSKGFCFRPLTVLELRGQKLELQLLDIAEKEEADEFIIGLPLSSDGKETVQSNKVRSVAGRLAARAAERGWRVYLQDEHGTSAEATYRMINILQNERLLWAKGNVCRSICFLPEVSSSPLGKKKPMPMPR
ncbi:putative pre-16S rRNA nuclease isoform X4 [Rhodamnia argentea]|uniref:Pre-16S rRNA nuclease isoform X4 n=1 Tax=Rhodamnia argentea TaxID=178133 RepID=A0ABM3GXG2_9MYRT|nr:putative pre-16S rRNA nuclease isoform X4 [Rhodamnia argentea]